MERFHGYSSDSAYEVIYPDIPIPFPSVVRFAPIPAKPFYPSAYQFVPETRAKKIKLTHMEPDHLATTIAPIIEEAESQTVKIVRPNEIEKLMNSYKKVESIFIGNFKNKNVSEIVDLVNKTIAKQEDLVRQNKSASAEGWDYMLGTIHKSLYLFMLPKTRKNAKLNYDDNVCISL